MSNLPDTTPTYWAVLIGINYYGKDSVPAGSTTTRAKCLEGCINDVQAAKGYLDRASVQVNMDILTATKPTDQSNNGPQEEPDAWPTFDNVEKALEKIRNFAKPGDSALIHYSGHGTRTPTVPNAGRPSTGQLALVLLDETGLRLMRGRTLGKRLEDIAGKGVFVTLVLDCCFSGDIFRGGSRNCATIRSIEYDSSFDEKSTQKQSNTEPAPRGLYGVLRDGHLHEDYWLVNPAQYTVLSAAGPHEIAEECTVSGQGIRGALSYFLYEALSIATQRGLQPSHQSIYQYVRTMFHASRPQQNPMCYGNKGLAFFTGPTAARHPGFIAVFQLKGGELSLDAGETHGVCSGDEYDAYPSGLQEISQETEAPVRLRVSTVRLLTSDLELAEDNGKHVIQNRGTGWVARLVTSVSAAKILVRRMPAVDATPLETSPAMRQCQFLHLYGADESEDPSCTFLITINDHNEYEVLDGLGQRIPSLPTISLQTPDAPSAFLRIVHHITKYKYFERINNRAPNNSLEASISLLPNCKPSPAGNFDVKHGGVWGFDIENSGTATLYVFVFDLGPSWSVTNIYEEAKKGEFVVVAPRGGLNTGKKRVRMRMEIPSDLQGRGYRQCEDVIKIFVTTVPTSFSSYVLPKLLHNASRLGREPGLEGTEIGHQVSLREILSGLGAGLHTRGRRSGFWMVENFIVRTSL
ncbi:Caspase domain containing protein [Rhypophila decipiens]